VNIFERLRRAIDEICSSAEARHRETIELCRELRDDVDVYEKLSRYRRMRGEERVGGGD